MVGDIELNNYMVRLYIDVIVVTNTVSIRTNKSIEYSHVLIYKRILLNKIKSTMLTMVLFSKVLLLLIIHTVPQRALDCRPGLGPRDGVRDWLDIIMWEGVEIISGFTLAKSWCPIQSLAKLPPPPPPGTFFLFLFWKKKNPPPQGGSF